MYIEYRWIVACYGPASEDTRTDEACYSARTCPEPAQLLYRLWGRLEGTTTWTPLGTRCSEGTPTSLEPDRPTITPGMVLNEIRRIGLPVLQARTQPEGKTLVNFDTIFFTDAEPFTATVTLLGQQVEIVAEPAEYTWHHGDGTASTTSTPGAPYPSKQVTHRYDDADTTVRPRVDVTYTARFRVNGGAWQEIGESVTVAGPESTLLVAEAAPVLSGDYS